MAYSTVHKTRQIVQVLPDLIIAGVSRHGNLSPTECIVQEIVS